MTPAAQFPAEITRLTELANELSNVAEQLDKLECEVYFLIQSMAQAGLSPEDEDKLWNVFFCGDPRVRSWSPGRAA